MSRTAIFIKGTDSRATAMKWCRLAPLGTLVQFTGSSRTLEQNKMMWMLLTDFSRQLKLCGKLWPQGKWRFILLHAFGKEVEFVPSLDENEFIPLPLSTSKLTAKEMTAFIEFILAEGAKRGVVFSHDEAAGISNQDQAARIGT